MRPVTGRRAGRDWGRPAGAEGLAAQPAAQTEGKSHRLTRAESQHRPATAQAWPLPPALSQRGQDDCAGAAGWFRAGPLHPVTLRPRCPPVAMAAVRALVAPRLAAASTFAPLPGFRPLWSSGPAPSPRATFHSSAPRPGARVALVSAPPRGRGAGSPEVGHRNPRSATPHHVDFP